MRRKINYQMLDAVHLSGLTPKKLSEMAGLGSNYVGNVINGGHKLSIKAAKKIAKLVPDWNYEVALSDIAKRKLDLAKKDIGIRLILQLMENRDINQRIISDSIGMARSSIDYIVSGNRPLSKRIAYLIQMAYPEFDADRALGRK